jgi:hypothetical protein
MKIEPLLEAREKGTQLPHHYESSILFFAEELLANDDETTGNLNARRSRSADMWARRLAHVSYHFAEAR